MSGNPQTLRLLLFFFALVAGVVTPARAQVRSLEGHDLAVLVQSNWVGGEGGGYFPLRIEAANRGETRELTFEFKCAPGVPGAQRTVRLEAGTTARFTLLVPLVRERSSGQLVISSSGEPLDGMSRTFSLPDVEIGGIPPAILTVSRQQPDLGPLESALQQARQSWSQDTLSGTLPGASFGSSLGLGLSAVQSNHQIVAPELLPESWLGYSTVDLTVISRQDFGTLPSGARRALLDWTQAGGTLIVFAAGSLPEVDGDLAELLGLPGSAGWEPADARNRPPAQSSEETGERGHWKVEPSPFVVRRSGLGQMAVIADNPLEPGAAAASADDWLWLLLSLPGHELSWIERQGGSSRVADSRFLEFLIPGQRSVPVGAMLVLVTLFTLAIGPLNYFLAWHRRRLSLLLVTIPGFALATTVLLFLYSLVAFGFDTQARIRSYTVLDQRTQTATTAARVSLYAPFAPGAGPAFPADTAVFPLHGPGTSPRLESIDWSDRQQLGPGWLPSRTRIQFQVVSPRPERRRLEIRSPGSGKLTLSNGFEVGLKQILVADDRGELYVATQIPAGGTAELAPADDVARRGFQRDWLEFPPELPDGLDPELVRSTVWQTQRTRRAGWRHHRIQVLPSTAPGQLENLWAARSRLIESEERFPPRTYLAILEANPGIPVGVPGVIEHSSIHVLQGDY